MQPSSKFDFEPNYVEVDGHRIHYVEAGAGEPMLFVHGNPTSSYIYRNVLREVADQTGRRCIAIDLLGFGKSDKPNIDYSCALHARLIEGFIQALNLTGIVLVAEDWGGFLAGYVMTKHPEWFQSAILMETFLWPMTWEEDSDPSIIFPFKLMRSPFGALFTQGMNLMVNKLIPEHCPISDESLQYYKDSLPTYKARKASGDFPKLIPMNKQPKASHDFALELQAGLSRIDFPVLWIKADPGVIVSMKNPIGMGRLEELERRLRDLTIQDFGEGYHFLTEERPERLVEMIVAWMVDHKLTVHETAT